jgi:molybdopterin-synthase adenylyltransferase
MMDNRLVSQSFLGPDSDVTLASLTVGIVGLCGGGSHLVHQLPLVGISKFVLADPDVVEDRNRNRLLGSTPADAATASAKTAVAERVILGINPKAQVTACRSRWQEAIESLRRCDVIFGCVDSYRERDDLERFCRRFLIPYIDLGMDVHEAPGGYSISGQVVLSSPGGPCLWCLGILNEKRLTQEAGRYGEAGSRPQVVWPNGVLASLAVGLLVQLVCPWHGSPQLSACCEFDGNRHRVETNRLDTAADLRCAHFRGEELGDQFFARG